MRTLNNREDGCLVCGNPYVEEHHIFFGTGYRKLSEKYNCKCYLCHEHHTGNSGVHFNKELDIKLKTECQKRLEVELGHDRYMKIFNRNYL